MECLLMCKSGLFRVWTGGALPALAVCAGLMAGAGVGMGASNQPEATAAKALADVAKLPPAAAGAVDFERDVKPILAGHCVSCHGAKKHEGGLRLDAKEAAFAGGDNGAVLTPGKSGESRLIHLTAGIDPDEIMPPAKKADPLTAEQVGVLRGWIDAGAPWPAGVEVGDGSSKKPHWAYRQPVRPALPEVKRADWVRNPIDRFVLARLEKEGLAASPEADRATFIRRVSFDLVGLPPTPEEVEAFEKDTRPDACEKVVDRLLASPHYGERWARVWLDVARYADTHGYERDHLRNMWPWRDWVIDAFNRDMPFDQFTIEQIAGDLLPNATTDQKIATGFHRNAMLNSEDGSDDEEWRVAAVVDRVNTTGEVWLGTTIGCAQCHTHKYDPFTMKEYYGLFAYLNNTADGGNANKFAGPEIEVPTRLFASQTDRAEIAALEAKLTAPDAAMDAEQAKWEQEVAPRVTWTTPADWEFTSRGGAAAARQEDGSWLIKSEPAGRDTYTITLAADLPAITAIRLEALPDASLPGNGPGRSTNGNFILSAFSASACAKGKDDFKPAPLVDPRADFSQKGQPIAATIDGKGNTGWGILPQTGKPHEAVWFLKQPIRFDGGMRLQFVLEQNGGEELMIGRMRISVTGDDLAKFGQPLPPPIAKVIATPRSQRTPEQSSALQQHYRASAPRLASVRDRLAALRPGPATGKTLVMQELPKPRQTFIMLRGNFQSPGDKAEPGVPAALNPLPSDAPPNRLGLARWLVDQGNPLTARVAVNRLWAPFWGYGIVKTSEDFGTKGEPPSHPLLLDWLAVEFMSPSAQAGEAAPAPWSTKHIHRLIALSAAYRQSSAVTPELLEKDPDNRLFARGPRVRLEAEMMRDQALAVSGLLTDRIGGPSVMPPQPAGVWNRPYSGSKWETSKGDDRYRRGLYTFWRRTAAYPSMTTFDAPSREICTIRRPRTNTPLQALTTLNDPVYLEAAGALARRALAADCATPGERIDYAFRLVLSRPPTAAERARLAALLDGELAHYRQDAQAARDLVGEASPTAPPSAAPPTASDPPAELAAWTVVGNVLLNLDETITKG